MNYRFPRKVFPQQKKIRKPNAFHKEDNSAEIYSDEELAHSLRNIVRQHKQNRKDKPQHESAPPLLCQTNQGILDLDSVEDGRQNLKQDLTFRVEDFINHVFGQINTDNPIKKEAVRSSNEYEKQGAIPKTKIKGQVKTVHQKQKRNEEPRCSPLAQNKGLRNAEVGGFCEEPFYYVVPENPSPDFILPEGSYYITPMLPGTQITGKVIFHPSRSKRTPPSKGADFGSLENLLEDVFDPPPGSINNLGKDSPRRRYLHLNIDPEECVEEGQNPNTDTIKSKKLCLEAKIFQLKSTLASAVEGLNIIETSLNLEAINSQNKNVYNKTIGKPDQEEDLIELSSGVGILKRYANLITLFPKRDEGFLMEKLREIGEAEEPFINFVLEECTLWKETNGGVDEDFLLILRGLKHLNFREAFELWVDNVGNTEKVLRVISEQKLKYIAQNLMNEFSDLDVNSARKLAEEYLEDEFFLDSERLKRKIQSQYERMVLALPDSDFNTLMEKCKQVQGDEDLVTNYIQETEKLNKILNHVLELQFILPDADPEFLRREVEIYLENNDDLDALTNRLLEDNYPKIKKNEMNAVKREMWQRYMCDFNVQEYLLKVPNPKDFERKRSNEAQRPIILQYLQVRYSERFGIEFLEETFEAHDENLTKTCKFLDESNEVIKLDHLSKFKHEPFDEALLQEICYVENREAIEMYLKKTEERRQIEEEEARIYDAFLTCPLCAEDELIPSEAATCPDGHVFCKECLKRYINVKVGDGTYVIRCPDEACDMLFTYKTLQELIPDSLLSKIVKNQQMEDLRVANVDGLEFCGFCEFAYIPKSEDKIFKCQNPECMNETCRKCGEKSHIPLRCEEVERPADVEARKRIEEAMSETLMRTCPRCGKKFVKIDGCNKIVCSCGAMICYLCQKQIDGYSHFRNGMCPLHTNNDELHHTRVIARGVQVRNDILEENPRTRILFDPEAIF